MFFLDMEYLIYPAGFLPFFAPRYCEDIEFSCQQLLEHSRILGAGAEDWLDTPMATPENHRKTSGYPLVIQHSHGKWRIYR